MAAPHGMTDLSSPDQGSNPCPLQLKHRVLTTGPPGKSHLFRFFFFFWLFCLEPYVFFCFFCFLFFEPYVFNHCQLCMQTASFSSFFFFWPCHVACRILVPWPGIEPPAVKVPSPNYWTARECPHFFFFFFLTLRVLMNGVGAKCLEFFVLLLPSLGCLNYLVGIYHSGSSIDISIALLY